MSTRRQFLLAGAGACALIGGFQVLPEFLQKFSGFDFTPLPRVPGFRTISAGTTSTTGFDVLMGLAPSEPISYSLMEVLEADPAKALFFEGIGTSASVPVAYFFDYYCPYCRILSKRIANLEDASQIVLSRHHWPIFGEASELAARAVLAAEAQAGAADLHERFMATPIRVTPAYLQHLAVDMNLSWSRLERDMKSRSVAASLERARGLSGLFGLIGTPAMVVGRTLVQGEVSHGRLQDLIEYERADRPRDDLSL